MSIEFSSRLRVTADLQRKRHFMLNPPPGHIGLKLRFLGQKMMKTTTTATTITTTTRTSTTTTTSTKKKTLMGCDTMEINLTVILVSEPLYDHQCLFVCLSVTHFGTFLQGHFAGTFDLISLSR